MEKRELEDSSLKSFALRVYAGCLRRLHLVRRMRIRRRSKRTLNLSRLKWWLQFLLFIEPNPKHTVVESDRVVLMLCLSAPLMVSFAVWTFLYALTLGVWTVPAVLFFTAAIITVELEIFHVIYDR